MSDKWPFRVSSHGGGAAMHVHVVADHGWMNTSRSPEMMEHYHALNHASGHADHSHLADDPVWGEVRTPYVDDRYFESLDARRSQRQEIDFSIRV